MALEGFCTQMGDTVTFEVLGPGEGFPTTLLCADKASVIIVFPDKQRRTQVNLCTTLRQQILPFECACI